jgi:hypothetical protein
MQKKFIALGVVVLLLIAAVGGYVLLEKQKVAAVNSFAECQAAGYPIMESFPEQCMTPDKRSFTNTVQPQSMEVTGEFVCLPHRDTGGEQTLECALGLKADDGTHYGLQDTDSQYSNVSGVGTGKRVKVTGKFTPKNDTKYNSAGVLTVESLEQL